MYKVWWMKEPANYGDLLTPYIFDYYNIPYEYASIGNANTLCVGSIIKHTKENTLVLGSGLIKNKQKPHPAANYKFVRGPYTRQRILDLGGQCPDIYGDAALLLPLLWPEKKKKYDVGIIPHISNYKEAKEKYTNYKVIDLRQDPKIVTNEITKCKKIISSSLHGIIVAHAYNIPAAWIKFTNKLVGDDIKFYDHYKSVNLEANLSTIESPKYTLGKYDIQPIREVFENL